LKVERRDRNDETENTQKQAENCPIFGGCPWPGTCNIDRHDRKCVFTAGNRRNVRGRDHLDRGIMAGRPGRGGKVSAKNLVLLAIILGAFVSLAIAWSIN
jgi:hypothetical protein